MFKLSKNCRICSEEEVIPQSVEDAIERTIECQLALDDGTALVVREITSRTQDTPKEVKKGCLCTEVDNRKKVHVTKVDIERKITKKGSGKVSRASSKQVGMTCQKRFSQMVRPKWYHHLSLKQIELLEDLPSAVSDDIHEGFNTRTQRTVKLMAFYPQPTTEQISSAIKCSENNPVLFLSKLLEFSDSDFLPGYSLNERILMTAITYYELPMILQTAHRILPESEEIPVSESKNCFSFTSLDKYRSPYLTPVLINMPKNWLEEKRTEGENYERTCRFNRRMRCPEDVFRSSCPLDHIEFQKFVSDSPKASSSTDADGCVVFKLWRDFEPPKKDSPLESPNVSSTVSKVDLQIPWIGNIESTLAAIIEEFKTRGMLCANYPELDRHPVIQQYIKHVQGFEVDKVLKTTLIDETAKNRDCLRELYRQPLLKIPLLRKPDTTWRNIRSARVRASSCRTNFFQHLWLNRYLTGLRAGHNLHPGYLFRGSFLPVYSAYMVSGYTNVVTWP